jgi:rfaE bifunctional protein nucleotidyltransferase chain/domain
MSGGPIVVLGDSLLDVDIEGEVERLCPDAPVPVVEVSAEHRRPGGAGLAALLAARDGAEVVVITAIGDDAPGGRLAGLLSAEVELIGLPLRGSTVQKTRVRARGQSMLRIDTGDGRAQSAEHGGGPARGTLDGRVWPGAAQRRLLDDRVATALRAAKAVLVSDYGGGTAELYREVLRALAAPLVWDPHPRGMSPVPGCTLVTPSQAEARVFHAGPDTTPDQAARDLVGDFAAQAVAVTLGQHGVVLARRGGPLVRIASPALITGQDSCGAGDRFAATATLALADGACIKDAVAVAVERAARFVGQGGAAAIRPLVATGDPPAVAWAGAGQEARAVIARVRAAGGRLVLTGGCFDLLHAGHISLLRRARALGDALIVCVNSDDSVRRLKGPGRPLVAEADRVEVLRALACVDAVVVFDQDTPAALIEDLQPDVWVKGGDYTGREMPEAAAVRRAGGEIVILSSVPGRSTTDLIVAARAAC